jgi:hypothetical protein
LRHAREAGDRDHVNARFADVIPRGQRAHDVIIKQAARADQLPRVAICGIERDGGARRSRRRASVTARIAVPPVHAAAPGRSGTDHAREQCLLGAASPRGADCTPLPTRGVHAVDAGAAVAAIDVAGIDVAMSVFVSAGGKAATSIALRRPRRDRMPATASRDTVRAPDHE